MKKLKYLIDQAYTDMEDLIYAIVSNRDQTKKIVRLLADYQEFIWDLISNASSEEINILLSEIKSN